MKPYTVKVVGGVVLVLFVVLVPITASVSPIVAVGGEDLTVGRQTTQGVGVVTKVTIMAMVTAVAAGLPQWTVSGGMSDIR